MNKPVSPLEAAMLALRATCSPTGVIHIGAGHGRGAIHAWRAWDIEYAVLVEADSTRFGWAHELASQSPGWRAIEAIVAAADGDVTYHKASNPDEDGLVQPDSLVQLWPRLRGAGTEKRTALPLDALLAPLPHAERLNWLIIDCFGTGQILEGAQAALAHADVVVLRSILDTQGDILAASSHAWQADQIRAAGLQALPFFESTHPLAGYAVFVRPVGLALQARQASLANGERAARKNADALAARLDTALTSSQTQLEQCEQARQAEISESKVALAAAYDELRVLRGRLDDAGATLAQATAAQAEAEHGRDEQAASIATLTTELESYRQAAAQLGSELEASSARHATLQAAMDSAAAAHLRDMDALGSKLDAQRRQLEQNAQTLSTLKGERDDLAKAASRHKGKISELEQARRDLSDQLAQQMQAQAAQAAQEEQARHKLARELKELRAAGQARQDEADRVSRQLSECKACSEQAEAEYSRKLGRMAELESENQRARHQHSLLQDELIKGEAQIELIKDLLLRDAGI
jgi:predicted  nucleic acid-binding Zn-ribbon protein